MSSSDDAKDRRERRRRGRAEWTTVRTVSAERPTIKREAAWEIEEPSEASKITRNAVPQVILPAEKILRLKVDARTGFVLALVDGRTSVDALSDISGLDEEELVAVLDLLRSLGAIALRPRPIE